MPIPITDFSGSNSGDEFAAAGIAGLTAFAMTQTGGNMIGHLAGKGLKALGRGAMRSARVGWSASKIATGTIRRGPFGLGYNAGAIPRFIGGSVRGASNTLSWMYKHPVVSALGAASIGGIAGLDLFGTDHLNNDAVMTPSFTEAMGGTSTGGTTQLMNTINANGSIVLGLHARR